MAGVAPSVPTYGVVADASGPSAVELRVRALLNSGRAAEAVTYAYVTAEADVRRAYGLTLPAEWTHREFVVRYLRPDMGPLPRLMERLHALYEPVRYGTPDPIRAEELLEVVRRIYAEASVRRAHDAAAPEPRPRSEPSAGRAAAPGGAP